MQYNNYSNNDDFFFFSKWSNEYGASLNADMQQNDLLSEQQAKWKALS